MDSTLLCRLCLETGDDLVNVSDSFEDSTIASILTQHFWFKVDKKDGSSAYVCDICWTHTKEFHNFYKKVEALHKRNSDDLAGSEEASSYCALIKEEPPLELDFKYEEAEQIDLERIKEDSSSASNDDSRCDQRNDAQTLVDEYHPPSKKRKADTQSSTDCDSDGSEVDDLDEPDRRSKTYSMTQSKRDQEAAQAREFFNMKCEICDNFEFETLAEARKHYRKIHNQIGYITCCGRRFRRHFKVVEHIESHCKPDTFRCDQCDKRFKNNRSLKSHVATHAPKSFKCDLCTSRFANATFLSVHVKTIHSSRNEDSFSCDKCNKDYASKSLLSFHIRNVHKNTCSYICDICGKEYKSKHALANHMYQHSTTPRPKVQCSICGAWLKHKESLHQHLKLYHDVQTTVVNCPICNKEVPNKNALRSHTQHVHGDWRYPCTLCGKVLKTPLMLKEHMAGHTGEDLYSCPYCEKTFKTGANMYSHRKKAHLEEWSRDRQNRGIGLQKIHTT